MYSIDPFVLLPAALHQIITVDNMTFVGSTKGCYITRMVHTLFCQKIANFGIHINET